ncbi:hypothetical protein [Undibacterium umbellatum]|uniref:Nuclear transport factor 2 family protein n=1 Tax=Undibacterium umbellatum TaxID=2762300 RepID=A0ABR6Z8C9_9BURK|nr:hypothetical protein [Undibacterium umbellatum]MBC3907826.1 hypothetical protein [Undibacterium umbellatum]
MQAQFTIPASSTGKQILVILLASLMLLITVFPMRADAAAAVAPATTYPLAADVSSIDGIMHAYYEVVSGPPNTPRNIARDISLHHPRAQIFPTVHEKNGDPRLLVFSVQEFHVWSKPVYDTGFYEREIAREVKSFGSSTHIWSTYETRQTPDGEVTSRGINNIQLYFDGQRYWILSETWDSESPRNPLPTKNGVSK